MQLPGPIAIYWFSGTGNTLLVVRRMAEVFRGHGVGVRLHPLEHADPRTVDTSGAVGLAFPVAAQGTHPFVWKFVESLPSARGTPVFMVDTMMGFSGGVVGPVRSIVEGRGYTPVGAREVIMPDNFMPGRRNALEDRKKRRAGLTAAETYANRLLVGKTCWGRLPVLPDAMSRVSRDRWLWRLSQKLFPLRVDKETCTRCGLCARLCPVGSVEMDEFPVFGDECSFCMRCIAFCPREAISTPGFDYRGYRAVKAGALVGSREPRKEGKLQSVGARAQNEGAARAVSAKPVVVVRYDAGWPVRYEVERQLVVGVLGDRVLGIEHMGSTAVPGLAAKPVVDMMAGVASRDVAEECLPALAGIGFADVTPCDEHPGWYFCVGKGERPHDVHLHLVEHGGRFWDRHIRFRDYLRAHPATGDEYARLKLTLAGRHGRARQAYCDAKTGFIKRVETRALGIEIREMEAGDVDAIMRTFARWNKRRTQYEEYVVKQERCERVVLLAWHLGSVAGYAVYTRDSTHHPFHRQGIAEIVDLNVIDEYQRQGVGTALVYECERIAADEGRKVIGISVGQSPESAAANRMYPALGYVPDGRGITDHDNELYLVKELDDWCVGRDRA